MKNFKFFGWQILIFTLLVGLIFVGKLSSVKIKRGVARIDFTRTIRGKEDYNPGDLLTLRFEAAVKKTAKQFPAVKKVIVCVNGVNEFGIGMVIDTPVPCPKDK